MEYPFNEIEKKWQDIWHEKKVFYASEKSEKPKYYVLDMFPYPSGSLHMGHVSNYSIGDAVARYKLMQGFNVMHPIGYDAFGMPAENFAILNNSHPRLTTESNIKNIGSQFRKLGFGFDFPRELSTCRPDYYHWGQWFFKRMYEKGLAYKKKSFVNWCESCQTVLANEQVEDGKCWRCSAPVIQKELAQWFFRITKYTEELLDFSKLIDWPERVVAMQTNWIGKSFGTRIDFRLENTEEMIPVFTTRPDTIFGVTFMALPPEHRLVSQWLAESNNGKMEKFCRKVINESKITRAADETMKEGFFSGHYCINPVNGQKVQIWITNYVLPDYGTGAVMAVPAHDQRDFEFAQKYDIPMLLVIQNPEQNLILEKMKQAYTEAGVMINSGKFDGKNNAEAKKEISTWIEEHGWGKITFSYRLRDWGISRQRYWGNPIPIVYCEKCGEVLIPDDELPVLLPDNVQVGKTTQNPLLSVPEWLNATCPKCGGSAKRETDTMDTFVDSSWYFARYTDPKNDKAPFSEEKSSYWLPVDQYIGGIEHACMHLLYARFFHKFMRDLGMVQGDEPFARLLTQGMVTKDGAKMSKSKGNVVDPKEYIERYGADTIRTFMLFASPPEKDVEWNDAGLSGAFRFLNRVWRLFDDHRQLIRQYAKVAGTGEISPELKKLRYSTHFTAKKFLEDLERRLQFNTAIAAVMEHLNNVTAIKNPEELNVAERSIFAQACLLIIRCMYPFAPHICEELWEQAGNNGLLHESGLPTYDSAFLVKDEIEYPIQVLGKLRGKLLASPDTEIETLKKLALEQENIKKHLEGMSVEKIIVVPKKLISIVAKKQ